MLLLKAQMHGFSFYCAHERHKVITLSCHKYFNIQKIASFCFKELYVIYTTGLFLLRYFFNNLSCNIVERKMTKAPEGNIYKSQQVSTYSFLFLTFFLSRCVCRCTCVRTCNPGVLYSAEVLGEECWESSHHTEASLDRKSPASPHCRSAMSYNLTLDNTAFPGFMQMTKTCSPISRSHSLSLSVFFLSNRHQGFQKEACLWVRIWFLA